MQHVSTSRGSKMGSWSFKAAQIQPTKVHPYHSPHVGINRGTLSGWGTLEHPLMSVHSESHLRERCPFLPITWTRNNCIRSSGSRRKKINYSVLFLTVDTISWAFRVIWCIILLLLFNFTVEDWLKARPTQVRMNEVKSQSYTRSLLSSKSIFKKKWYMSIKVPNST